MFIATTCGLLLRFNFGVNPTLTLSVNGGYTLDMTKPMKRRDAVKLLKQAGFTPRQGKGDHEVWRNGSVVVAITQTRELSPKVTRDMLNAIERSKQ